MSGGENLRLTPLSIEDQVCALLDPVLADCVRQRTAFGVAKYGQTLDDNHQPHRARVVHAMQELLDSCQYLTWAGRPGFAHQVAQIANELLAETGLSAEEIMSGGKQ